MPRQFAARLTVLTTGLLICAVARADEPQPQPRISVLSRQSRIRHLHIDRARLSRNLGHSKYSNSRPRLCGPRRFSPMELGQIRHRRIRRQRSLTVMRCRRGLCPGEHATESRLAILLRCLAK